MAPPTALLGLAYFALIFSQVCSSPFWSQPDCPDQGQGGHWSGSDYDSQGPSYQQTLQAMVAETLRCIQQVIQVTKREMNLLLRQLAQDEDCNLPPGNTYGDYTPGQIQFPPPDSGYNYDRPHDQLQYPAQYQPSGPLTQPQVPNYQLSEQLQNMPDSRPLVGTDLDQPQVQLQNPAQYQPSGSQIQQPLQLPMKIHYQAPEQQHDFPQQQYLPDSRPLVGTNFNVPLNQPSDHLVQAPLQPQVQVHYQPQAQLQGILQKQPQNHTQSQSLLNTHSYIVNCTHGNANFSHDIPSSTVENRISSSEAPETTHPISENADSSHDILSSTVEHEISSSEAPETTHLSSGNSESNHAIPSSMVENNISSYEPHLTSPASSVNTILNQDIPSSTVVTKMPPSETHETTTTSIEHSSEKPQTHTEPVEISTMNANTTLNNISEGIKVQSDNGSTNSTESNAVSNMTASQSNSSMVTEAIININHDSIGGNNESSSSTPTVTSTNFTVEQATTTTEKAPIEANIVLPNNSTMDITDIPILIHGAPVTIPNITSTTAGNDNTTNNIVTIPSPMHNEVDVSIENLTHKEDMININALSSSNETTPSMPIEQTPSTVNSTENNTVNSGESVISTGNSATQSNMTQETTTKTATEFSPVGNSTHENTIEATTESSSVTEKIVKLNELQLQNATTTTDSSVISESVRKSKL